MPSTHQCVFCKIIAGELPSIKVAEWPDAIAIVPLDPVTGGRFSHGDGHVLVIPKAHVADYSTDPMVTAATFGHAAELARGRDSNLITSKGEAATQTVFHLHVHLVPRVAGDSLPLPWTPQQSREVSPTYATVCPEDPAEYLCAGGVRIDDCARGMVKHARNLTREVVATFNGVRLKTPPGILAEDLTPRDLEIAALWVVDSYFARMDRRGVGVQTDVAVCEGSKG